MALSTNTNVELFTTDYGQSLRVESNYSLIGDATSLALKMKETSAGTTAEITGGSVVGGGATDNYAVDFTIASGFLTSKAGTWRCRMLATFSDALIYSDEFFVTVKAPDVV